MAVSFRIGLAVPSSNVTVESELPAVLGRHPGARFTFHSSRMAMNTVSPSELAAMDAQRARAVDELADAEVDALLYGCLVAVTAQGLGAHRRVEAAITAQLRGRHLDAPALSSAGALVEALHTVGARRIAVVTPYVRPLAQQVVDYLQAEQITVADWVALEEPDNARVGRIDPTRLVEAARTLRLTGVEVLVLSACVQMPSLATIEPAEQEFGVPVLTATTAAAHVLLRRLGLPIGLPNAGLLLTDTRDDPPHQQPAHRRAMHSRSLGAHR
jgi:maleate isomerase